MIPFLITVIVILFILFILSYFDYKLYDSKKVPRGTPDIVQDVKTAVKKRANSASQKTKKYGK